MAGAGRRTFTPGEVLTASNVMNYLQDQAVMAFAGTAARGSAIGTAVSEGMVSYLADSNNIEVYDGSNWVSQTAGLVPIVPTSVSVGSGSASVAIDGTVTLTSATTPIFNGIFTSRFKNYRVYLQRSDSTANINWGSQLQIKFAAGGTANSSSNYTHTSWYIQVTSGASNAGTSTGTTAITTGYGKDFIIDVLQPQVSNTGSQVYINGLYNNTNMWGQGGYNASASFDGIQFLNNTFTGTFKVYGVN